MKTKAILGVLLLISLPAKAELLDQLRDPSGCVLGCPPADGGGGGGGETVVPLSEVEPNDTPQTATPLSTGQLQSGTFQAGDQDWYRFRVTQIGTAATLEIPPQRGGFQLSLQSASGQVFARFQSDAKATRKFAVVLPQLGDFFLVAESLGASSYAFTFSGEGIAPPITGPGGLPEGTLTEVEPNDTQATATALKPAAFHGGQVAASDLDFFRFQVTAPGAIEVFLPSSSGDFNLAVLDASGRILANQKSAAFDQTFTFVASTPGDCFVRLSAQGATPASYLFKLTGDTIQLPLIDRLDRRNEFLRQAQREVEPNDSLVAANPIVPGRPVAGQMRIKDDEDWFALRTVQTNTVVNVEMPKGPAKWKISVFDAAGNLLDARESSTDSDLLFSTTIEHVGKFYLSVAAIDDTRGDYAFNITGEGLQNPSDRNPNANFYNVELEPNDILNDTNPLTSAVRLLGQLRTGSDIDLFKIDSPGNEILSLDLCPENTSCAEQFSGNSGPWVVYVFDQNLSQKILDQTATLQRCVNSQTGEIEQIPVKHLYLSLNLGLLDPALLGVIDPAFGTSRKLEIGLRQPGTYFLAVSSPLKRDANGSVILETKDVKCGQREVPGADGGTVKEDIKITETRVEVFPFSDDQYELRVVQTSLTPTMTPVLVQRQELAGDLVYVPFVEVNGMEYSAELRLVSQGSRPLLELVRIEQIGTAVAAQDADFLKREAMRATVSGDIVHIPLALYAGHYYAGELRMFEDNGRLLFEVVAAMPLD